METVKDITWYQQKAVSLISMILAVVSICSLIVSMMWNAKVIGQMGEDLKWLKACQLEQIAINSKLTTLAEK